MPPKALAIVRISQVNGREEAEGFASPGVQRDRVADLCAREGLELAGTFEEFDVGGSKPLSQRPGLSAALAAIEARQADVLVVAYFDRLVRSLEVQTALLRRVEAAGGRVVSADIGEVSHDTAANWLNATMHGMMAEYHNRITAEKTRAAQVRAISHGIPPIKLPPGMRRVGDRIELDEAAPAVAEAVRMRAEGATVRDVQAHLARHGIVRSFHGTSSLLRSRLLIGEIVFGSWTGECVPVVDRETWMRAQAVSVPRGRRAKSERLLARLGVLRCGTCDARMVVGTSNHGRYHIYRCPPTGGCPQRVTISAETAERVVVERVREALGDAEGRASMETDARAAELAAARAQADLEAAIRAFAVVGDEPVAIERLAGLRAERDRTQREAGHLGGLLPALTINAARDWDRLTVDERRALVRAVVARAVVVPGRGGGRVRVELFGEEPSGGTVEDA